MAAGSTSSVSRALLRSLLRAAHSLDVELARCPPALRRRERGAVRVAAIAALPVWRRGDVPPLVVAPSDNDGVEDSLISTGGNDNGSDDDNGTSTGNCSDHSNRDGQQMETVAVKAPTFRQSSLVRFVSATARMLSTIAPTIPTATVNACTSTVTRGTNTPSETVPSVVSAVTDSSYNDIENHDTFESIEDDHYHKAAFATLHHLHTRLHALHPLVYTTSSTTNTLGIHVQARSTFQGLLDRKQSRTNSTHDSTSSSSSTAGAGEPRYLFLYHIRITNASTSPVKLLSRSWTIRDSDGHTSHVHGPGVVGDFPTLQPQGGVFEYTSAAPLHAPVGTQGGFYTFVTLPSSSAAGKDDKNDGPSSEKHNSDQANNFEDGDDDDESSRGGNANRVLHVAIAPFGHRAPSVDEQPPDGVEAKTASPDTSLKTTRRRRRWGDEARRR